MGYHDTLKECEDMMQTTSTMTGSVQNVRYPILTVFAGREAVANRGVVERVYRNCWPAQGRDLNVLSKEKLALHNIGDAVSDSLARKIYQDFDKVYIVIYWDIMDDNFDANFEAIREKINIPPTFEVRNLIYCFGRRQKFAEKKTMQGRIEKVVSWGTEAGVHIMILSDVTQSGFLGPEEVWENYQLAADVTVIANSVDSENRSSMLGFELTQGPFFSAGYYSQGKNKREIAAASLTRILDYYQALAQGGTEIVNIERNFGTYQTYFDGLFEKYFAEFLPKDKSLFRYLDYTPQMQAFFDSFTPRRGLLGLFSRNQAPQFNYDAAVAARESVDLYWRAILDMYYRKPIEKFLKNEISAEADFEGNGENLIRTELKGGLTRKFSYQQLVSRELLDEARRLKEMTLESVDKEVAAITSAASAQDWFAATALREIKVEFYLKMYHMLGEEFQILYDNAGSFSDKLRAAEDYYSNISRDVSIRTAYGNLVAEECAKDPDYLRSVITPCDTEEALLDELRKVYRHFVNRRPEYKLPQAEELKWRIGEAGAVVNDDMLTLQRDVRDTGRIQTYNAGLGKQYSLMKADAQMMMGLNPNNLGETFNISQSDQIECLYIYPIDPDGIIW